jgi:hypothetical protein
MVVIGGDDETVGPDDKAGGDSGLERLEVEPDVLIGSAVADLKPAR